MMEKKMLPAALLTGIAFLTIMFTGCAVFAEFEGTWSMPTGGATETITFSKTSLNGTFSGSSTGTLSCTIDTYDESADHIHLTVNSMTGLYTSLYVGGPGFYATYRISGNQLFWAISTTDYPGSANMGPFTKQ